MSASEKKLNVRVSAEVKARLVAEAQERDLCINDVAVGILAERYRVIFQGTGRRSNGAHKPEGPMVFTVPLALYRKIHAAALTRTKTEVVEQDFRDHFGLVDAAAAA